MGGTKSGRDEEHEMTGGRETEAAHLGAENVGQPFTGAPLLKMRLNRLSARQLGRGREQQRGA